MTREEQEEAVVTAYVDFMREAAMSLPSDQRVASVGGRDVAFDSDPDVLNVGESTVEVSELAVAVGRELVRRLHLAGLRISRAQ